MKWIHLEDLEDRMSQIEISLAEEEERTRAWIELQLDEASGDPEFARRAQERGQDLGDALVELATELWRPYQEIKQRRAPAFDAGDVVLDRRARRYAERHGVSYEVGLNVAIAGEARVNLESEGAPGQPRTDADDVRLDRKARRYAERHGVPYEVALEAVLKEEG